MDFYQVTGAELAYEKQRVRDNFEDAKRCYLDIYKKLKGGRDEK